MLEPLIVELKLAHRSMKALSIILNRASILSFFPHLTLVHAYYASVYLAVREGLGRVRTRREEERSARLELVCLLKHGIRLNL